MAHSTVTPSPAKPDDARIGLALNALEELEMLMRAQAAYIREQGAPVEMLVLRSHAMRGLQLASVAMASLGDMADDLDSLQIRLTGPQGD